ncbi:Omp28-related outer membrane protein [uncultured Bacteroides sp.]|uniref:Omp28-related outer membrane protein n=1 Tax=uncultured Bacteroides sp. TaxID=162156 RepID=UPI0026398714|nr:Omp28-related outer membrane protein [uncultured Bacteroides sp.]
MKKLGVLNTIWAFLVMLCMVACSGTDDEGTDGGVTPTPDAKGELVLTPSKSFIAADGQDAVTFTVTKGKNDVTSSAKIYLGSDEYGKTSFSTTEAGEYKFFASYEGEISEKVTIKAVSGDAGEVPADPKPEQFTDFDQHVIGLLSTGTWCPNCPLLICAIQKYKAENSDSKIIFAEAHDGDGMANSFTGTLNNWAKIEGYPTITMNLDSKYAVGSYQDIDYNIQNIKSQSDKLLKLGANTCIAASVKPSGNVLTVKASVKVATDNKYRAAAWVLEDGIYEKQSNGYSTLTIGYDVDTHHDVIRLSSSSKAYGDELANGNVMAAGETTDFACNLDLTDKVSNIANCRVVIVTFAPVDGKFIVDNAVECPIGGSVAFQYK